MKRNIHAIQGDTKIHNRLDYFFMFKNDVTPAKSHTNGSINMSDHAAGTLTVILKSSKRRTILRLNNSLYRLSNLLKTLKRI